MPPDPEGRQGRSAPRFGWGFSAFALLVVYFVLRIVVGFWWALALTVAAALVLAVFRFVGALTR
jgi:hypothetical protein